MNKNRETGKCDTFNKKRNKILKNDNNNTALKIIFNE